MHTTVHVNRLRDAPLGIKGDQGPACQMMLRFAMGVNRNGRNAFGVTLESVKEAALLSGICRSEIRKFVNSSTLGIPNPKRVRRLVCAPSHALMMLCHLLYTKGGACCRPFAMASHVSAVASELQHVMESAMAAMDRAAVDPAVAIKHIRGLECICIQVKAASHT